MNTMMIAFARTFFLSLPLVRYRRRRTHRKVEAGRRGSVTKTPRVVLPMMIAARHMLLDGPIPRLLRSRPVRHRPPIPPPRRRRHRRGELVTPTTRAFRRPPHRRGGEIVPAGPVGRRRPLPSLLLPVPVDARRSLLLPAARLDGNLVDARRAAVGRRRRLRHRSPRATKTMTTTTIIAPSSVTAFLILLHRVVRAP